MQHNKSGRGLRIMKENPALLFVVLLGVVSLFSDMTHEGARSITGPFLGSLGADATTVGVIAGFGEFVGYALRLFSGYISDRTRRYWLVTGVGYVLNLLSVPLLALSGSWKTAAVLMVLERAGRAIRNPARDAMLSHATARMGRGAGFGLHEALDQIGATVGPLAISFIMISGGTYHGAFAFLLLPALAALLLVAAARIIFPKPETFEAGTETLEGASQLPGLFRLYIVAASLAAAGFVDYPLIAYHIGRYGHLPVYWTAVLYTVAMGIDAISALVFGRLYDKWGLRILVVSTLASFLFAPLAFLGGPVFVILGVLLWGIGMGAQESIMRAAIGDLAPKNKRATAYGIFNVFYGISWFAGSALFGLIYDRSIIWAVALSVVLQLSAIPFFWACHSRRSAGA